MHGQSTTDHNTLQSKFVSNIVVEGDGMTLQSGSGSRFLTGQHDVVIVDFGGS